MSEKLEIDDVFRRAFERGSLNIEPEEHVDDRAARIRRETREQVLGQIANAIIVGALVAAGVFAAVLALSEEAIISDWARNAFTAIVAGGVSFFTGREVGRRT